MVPSPLPPLAIATLISRVEPTPVTRSDAPVAPDSPRILVVDDEPLARLRLLRLLQRVAPAATVHEAADGEAALAAIRDWHPDAIFLDIRMPGPDGVTVAQSMGPTALPPTVFVTAHPEHAPTAFDVAAVDYLLKPFDDARFSLAWSRVRDRLAAAMARSGGASAPERWAERFVVRVGSRSVLVPVDDVAWMESDGNYVDLHTRAGRHTVRETLANVEQRLDPRRFVRIHRRTIVAIDRIRAIRPWFGGDQQLELHDGTILRISRTRRAHVAATLAGIVG